MSSATDFILAIKDFRVYQERHKFLKSSYSEVSQRLREEVGRNKAVEVEVTSCYATLRNFDFSKKQWESVQGIMF